jgi:hypothetical protein
MLWQLFIIFVGGIFVDLLVTKYTRSVATGRPKTAAALSGIITLANVGIWGTIIHEAETLGVYGAISMALGASVGTLLGFKQKLSFHESESVASPASAPASTPSSGVSASPAVAAASTAASGPPTTVTGLISP